MAETTIKIPKPTNEDQLSWSRAGVGDWRLVWDKSTRKWTIRKLKDILDGEITFDDWKSGEKSYIAPAAGGTEIPTDVKERVAATSDPLAGLIQRHGLEVTTDPSNGRTYLRGFTVDANGKRGTQAVPFYLYLDKNNTIQVSENFDAVKKATLADLKATNQLSTYFQELYNKKLISKETYNSKNINAADFNAALLGTIDEYSKNVIGNRQFSGVTEAPKFLDYVRTGINVSGGGVSEADMPRREFQDISKEELNAFIDKIYLETIGRKPTDEQRAAKFKELNSIVKKGIVSTRTVKNGEVQYRTTGGFNEQKQGLALQEKLKAENPLEYERRQAFGFMDELQKIMSGGM